MPADEARAWVKRYAAMVSEAGQPSPRSHAWTGGGTWSDDQSLESLMEVIHARSRRVSSAVPSLPDVIQRSWVAAIHSGYCTTELRAVGREFALIVESGLHSTVWLAAQLAASCFSLEQRFDPDRLSPSSKSSFHRFFTTYVGQYYLYGRIWQDVPIAPKQHLETAGRVASEAMIFVLAHELAHAAAGHVPTDVGSAVSTNDFELHYSDQEDEADALAAYVSLGDLWNDSVTPEELQVRLCGIRIAFLVLETVEHCALSPPMAQHRSSLQRWNSIESSLEPLLPPDAIAKHANLWSQLQPFLTFQDIVNPRPPTTSMLGDLVHHGWLSDESVRHQDFWASAEIAIRQFRLPRPMLDALIGFEVCAASTMSDQTLADAYHLGRAAADSMLQSFPRRFRHNGSRLGSTTSGDLMVYLRQRDRWPEPFLGNPEAILPLHTMVAALSRRIRDWPATHQGPDK